jgi:hypothetical protein
MALLKGKQKDPVPLRDRRDTGGDFREGFLHHVPRREIPGLLLRKP